MAEPTVRELLEENVASLRDEQVDTPVDEAPKAEESKAEGERARDEQGRFAKTDKPAEAVTEPQPVTPTPEPELKPIQRPSSWKKEMWGVWDKMAQGQPLTPQEARQVAEYNAQREQQFATGVSTYKQEADRSRPIMEAIAPFQAEMDQYGVQAPQMVHALMSAHRVLSLGSPQEKLQNIVKVIEGYGIPIQALYDQAAQQQFLNSRPNTPLSPPAQKAPDINSLIEQALQQREVKQTISSMEGDREKYPFFPYVRGTMAQLLETGVATDLDELYQLALNQPEHQMLTGALQQQQTRLEQQKEIEAKKVAAKIARANVTSPKSSTPVSTAPNGKTSVRDALKESIAIHAGSARV